jgi:hypothetical protein
VDFDPRLKVAGIAGLILEGGEVEVAFLGVGVVAVKAVLFQKWATRFCRRKRVGPGQGEKAKEREGKTM